jgi:predicted phage terminase large subunit-like protein
MIEDLHPWDLTRIVVGVDPAVTSGEDADETGIIVAGVGRDGDGYVLEDQSCRESPQGWARRVVETYRRWEADRVIAECNNGGQLVETVLRTQDDRLPVTLVHASRGKHARAEPIAALYEQGRVHHVGCFPELEQQMVEWVPGTGESPDRVDALVWALTWLMLTQPPLSSFLADRDASFFAARPGASRWETQ